MTKSTDSELVSCFILVYVLNNSTYLLHSLSEY